MRITIELDGSDLTDDLVIKVSHGTTEQRVATVERVAQDAGPAAVSELSSAAAPDVADVPATDAGQAPSAAGDSDEGKPWL